MVIYRKIDKYNFYKQDSPTEFIYDEKYSKNQSTNIEMSYLRLGWISSVFNYNEMKNMNVVDIGSGNKCFSKCSRNFFKNIYTFDLNGEDHITHDTLYNNIWDLICMTDVLEHYNNINDLFLLKWKYLFISYPECPTDINLKTWKHYKPNEHIWLLNNIGMKLWFKDNNCTIIKEDTFEDFIRTRWNDKYKNITSMIVKNDNY